MEVILNAVAADSFVRVSMLRAVRLVRILRPIRLLKRIRMLRELHKLTIMMLGKGGELCYLTLRRKSCRWSRHLSVTEDGDLLSHFAVELLAVLRSDDGLGDADG